MTNKVLTQEEINALLANAGPPEVAAPADTPAPVTAPTAPPAPANEEDDKEKAKQQQPDAPEDSHGEKPEGPVTQVAPAQTPVAAPPVLPQPVAMPALDPAASHKLALLEQRLARLDVILERLDIMDRQIGNLKTARQETNGEMDAAEVRRRKLGRRLDAIESNLAATPAYDLEHTFICGNCHSKGGVAVRVRCTECDAEGWVRRGKKAPRKASVPRQEAAKAPRKAPRKAAAARHEPARKPLTARGRTPARPGRAKT